MQDSYYVDYRTNRMVKNLDTTFLAPELYNEVLVNDVMAGSYIYTYEDVVGKLLTFTFTLQEIQQSNIPFEEMLNHHCQRYNFKPKTLIRKVVVITQEEFNEALADMQQQQGEPEELIEERIETTYYSGEYLTAAATMIAWQLIDKDEEPTDRETLTEDVAHLFRQHCPMAYAYFFEISITDNPIQSGVVDIVLDIVWKERPDFMGGKVVNGVKITL